MAFSAISQTCHLVKFWFGCKSSKPTAVLSPGTQALLPHLCTGSDRYIDTTTIRDQLTVRKLTLSPLVFWEFFFYRMVVLGCHVANSPLAMCHAQQGLRPDNLIKI